MAIPDPISTIKNISEIIKKYNDIELMKEVIDLQSEVFELQKENLALKKQLEGRTQMQMKRPHGYYFQDGDDVPFCPKCWEKDAKAIHLPEPKDTAFYGHARVCRVCTHPYTEGPSQSQRQGRLEPQGGPWS